MVRIFFLLLLLPQLAFTQLLSNPSFEGPTGSSKTPPEWVACNLFSTPDTQPGAWNVSTSPSDGRSYISLVTRGLNGEEKDVSREALSAEFAVPLEPGTTYKFSFDLAYSFDFDDLWYYPNWRPVKLNVYLGNAHCDKSELAWESPEIRNHQWVKHSFLYPATTAFKFILLEADFATDPPYNGNILVDHIVIRGGGDNGGGHQNHLPNESAGCKLGVPNVFTPNNDNYNDQFTIQHSAPVERYSIKVYDRWGQLVFKNSDIESAWDGNNETGGQAPSGIYYYAIDCLCIRANTIQEDNLRGSISLLR